MKEQLNEYKIRIIQDYQEKQVEGQLMKLKMKKALEDEQKEKILIEQKKQEQRKEYIESNKRLIEYKQIQKKKELEEENESSFEEPENNSSEISISNRNISTKVIETKKKENMKKNLEEEYYSVRYSFNDINLKQVELEKAIYNPIVIVLVEYSELLLSSKINFFCTKCTQG